MHNLSAKILFSIMLIGLFGLTVFGDVVPDEVENSGGNGGSTKSNLSDEYVGRCTGENVRIRSSASKNGQILSSNTKKGDHFVVVGTKGDWCQIRLPEFVSVWISRKYVKAEEGNMTGIVTGNDVRLRTDKTTKSVIIGKVNKGTEVQIIASTNDWFLILPLENATGWISKQFIRQRGSVGAYAEILNKARNEYLARAAAYYESKGQSDLAKIYLSLISEFEPPIPTPPDPESLETIKYNALLLKYRQMDTSRETADVAALKAFAQEVLTFAESCKSDVKDSAMNLYNDVMNITKSIEDYLKKMADEDAAKNARIKAEAEKKKILEEVDIRLMRKDIGKYVAKGVVVDKQVPETGESIYFLQINGEDKYRLVAINSDINIREFWRREIGIKGKIVYDENEEYPIVLCEQVDVFNAN